MDGRWRERERVREREREKERDRGTQTVKTSHRRYSRKWFGKMSEMWIDKI
jgi:hypothetical protein